MKSTITSKGQITIPAKLRIKFGLKPGQIIEFDDQAPYLKATKAIDREQMESVRGCLADKKTKEIGDYLDETRGKVEVPESKP